MNHEQEYFDVLRKIAKDYRPSEWLTDEHAEMYYGVEGHEALEMSYDNIQSEAAAAISGRKRPKP